MLYYYSSRGTPDYISLDSRLVVRYVPLDSLHVCVGQKDFAQVQVFDSATLERVRTEPLFALPLLGSITSHLIGLLCERINILRLATSPLSGIAYVHACKTVIVASGCSESHCARIVRVANCAKEMKDSGAKSSQILSGERPS